MRLIKSTLVLLFFLAVLPFTVNADDPEGFDKYFSNISEKLSMSNEQVNETRPIFLSYYDETAVIFKKYGFNPEEGKKPGIFKLEDMKKEIEKNEKTTDSKLESILSNEQMDELAEVRKEEAKQLMTELKEHEK